MTSLSDTLYCFLNEERQCGADCMAYRSMPEEPSPYLDQAQTHCLILASVERLGRGVHGVGSLLKQMKVQADDAKRNPNHPPPNPLGRR